MLFNISTFLQKCLLNDETQSIKKNPPSVTQDLRLQLLSSVKARVTEAREEILAFE